MYVCTYVCQSRLSVRLSICLLLICLIVCPSHLYVCMYVCLYDDVSVICMSVRLSEGLLVGTYRTRRIEMARMIQPATSTTSVMLYSTSSHSSPPSQILVLLVTRPTLPWWTLLIQLSDEIGVGILVHPPGHIQLMHSWIPASIEQ